MVKKKYFAKLENYLQLLLKECRKLSKRKEQPKDWCSPVCASCLAAEVRSKIDVENDSPLYTDEADLCMFKARDILGTELNWTIN